MKTITWFKTIEDVEKTLQWIEDNTNYTWDWEEKPTEYNWWKDNFNDCQNNWWFYIEYKDNFDYWIINCNWGWREQINFKDLIWEGFKAWEELKAWEEVYVDEYSIENALEDKSKRIYLWNFNWKNLCVEAGGEHSFKSWKSYSANSRNYIAKIPKEETIKITADNWEELEIIKKKARELWFNIK